MREAIVLAGGAGTRLRHLIPDLPKPMAPIGKRPFLEILLGHLASHGVDRVVLSLGYMAEKIRTHFGNSFNGMQVAYVVEDRPLGTGGAIRLAMECCQEDHVFVFNGDTFLDLEIETVDRFWSINRHPVVVGREVVDTARYGRLIVEHGRLTGFSEKELPVPGLINAGCYVLNKGQLDHYLTGSAFSFETDYLEKVLPSMLVDVYVTSGYFVDIGVPTDYYRAQEELAVRL